ncbi:MAG: Rne/Rng family ribonuclease [Clostridia bacterium]|jgi:ribonuclease G|nr:Rne/Rng family ribonuclease [Clostridia bacterium]
MKEIFINKIENVSKIVLIENGNVIEKYEEDDRKKRLEGKIYLGTVQNVLQGMQAAFINIGEAKNTFIHLKDILPKVNVVNNKEVQIEQNIKKLIKAGDKILIQVKRDATSIKGAKVSTHISIPSRYFVLMPNTDIRTISQKIEQEAERNRLNEITSRILPKNFGVIIRTSALNKKEEVLEKDLKSVIKLWKNIEKQVGLENIDIPKIVYEGQTFIQKLLVDLVDMEIERIVVNDKKIFEEVKRAITELEEFDVKIEFKENENIFKTYDIEEQLEKSEQRKIWLRCGGFITIDKTEALTAIDVNSGKYIGSKDLEQTVFKVNKEASEEIAKQLRLRDIGGIIIIDYIDMADEKHKRQVIDILEENFKKDRSKTQIVGFSKLNLLEMTRKHMKGGE